MNKKMLAVVPAVAALVLGPLAGTAVADGGGGGGGGGGGTPLHGHMLVLGVVYDESGEPVGFRKCVDLANGNWLPLKAHHRNLHQGKGGEALLKAGHMVVPTAPLWPEVSNCADLEAMVR